MLETLEGFETPPLILDQEFVDKILGVLADVLKGLVVEVVVEAGDVSKGLHVRFAHKG